MNNNTQKQLFDLLFIIQARMKTIVKDADAGLSPVQILILRTLVENGELSQHEIGEKLGRDKAQITRLIQGLEKKGLISKHKSNLDKRSFIIKAMPDVHDKVNAFIDYEKELTTTMLEGISDSDKEKLGEMLAVMRQNLC